MMILDQLQLFSSQMLLCSQGLLALIDPASLALVTDAAKQVKRSRSSARHCSLLRVQVCPSLA